MLYFIKNLKGKKPTQYLGVISAHLIEILDNDDSLRNTLKTRKLQSLYKPSDKDRFTGNNQRMVLMSKDSPGLFVFKKISLGNVPGIELLILDATTDDISSLLKQAVALAALRWPTLIVRINTGGHHQNIANLKSILFNLEWKESSQDSVMQKSLWKSTTGISTPIVF